MALTRDFKETVQARAARDPRFRRELLREGGLAAYNGGDKRVKLWLANDKADGILWPETRAYIPFVLNLYDEFKSTSL